MSDLAPVTLPLTAEETAALQAIAPDDCPARIGTAIIIETLRDLQADDAGRVRSLVRWGGFDPDAAEEACT